MPCCCIHKLTVSLWLYLSQNTRDKNDNVTRKYIGMHEIQAYIMTLLCTTILRKNQSCDECLGICYMEL